MGNPAEAGKSRCQACHDRDMQQRAKHRRVLEKKAVEHLGGQCIDCGMGTDILAVYDFHHMNSDEKDTAIGPMIDDNCKWERLRAELDKCVLLCANYHRIRHALQDDDLIHISSSGLLPG